MRHWLLTIALTLIPTAAHADWKPALAIAIGQSLDIASTIRFNAKYPPGHWRGDGACHEDTNFFRAPDGGYRASRASLVGAGLTAASLGLDAIFRSKPRVRRVTHWLSYGVGAVGVFNAVRNVHNCGW
jgi:hypothetical protein